MSLKSRPLNPKYDVDSVLEELNGANPRAAAIVGAAWLDDLLLRLLTGFMIPGKEVDRLLGADGRGPLASSSARTRLAYCLGLITHTEMQDLLTIGKIRNLFAHRIHRSTFDNNKISDLSYKLRIGPRLVSDRSNATAGDLFLTTIATLAYSLANRPQAEFAARRNPIRPSTLEDIRQQMSAG
jgi:DNA-binding MltR family transcriptional regulator